MTVRKARPTAQRAAPAREQDPRVRAVVTRMQERLEEPVSCVALAASVNLSTRQLERLFQAEFQCSVKQYYLRMRLQHSLALLRETNLSVTEIGFASGFQNPNHFTTAFGRHFKVSPRRARYRRSHGTAEDRAAG